MSYIICEKLYTDFPFAHRQHVHNGHCAFIHGHNWAFKLTFSASELDPCGFVVDFGKLKFIKTWMGHMFDHTLLLNSEDPQRDYIISCFTSPKLEQAQCANIRVVKDCSCEGLALLVYGQVNDLLRTHMPECYNRRLLRCIAVTVIEDSKNSATFDMRNRHEI